MTSLKEKSLRVRDGASALRPTVALECTVGPDLDQGRDGGQYQHAAGALGVEYTFIPLMEKKVSWPPTWRSPPAFLSYS